MAVVGSILRRRIRLGYGGKRLSNFRVCTKSNTTDATSGAETSYKCSFIPNVIDSWNLLDVDTQNQHSRLMFKKQIISNISVPPPYFALDT